MNIFKVGLRNEKMDRIFMVYENIFGPEGCLPLPRGFIHVYDHNVPTSSSLKPLGQSKPYFMRSILRKSK